MVGGVVAVVVGGGVAVVVGGGGAAVVVGLALLGAAVDVGAAVVLGRLVVVDGVLVVAVVDAAVVGAGREMPGSSTAPFDDAHAAAATGIAATSKERHVRRTRISTVATDPSRGRDTEHSQRANRPDGRSRTGVHGGPQGGGAPVRCENGRMQQLLAALGIVGAALLTAAVVRRRRPDPPSQPVGYTVPAQLDRVDFDRADAPWLVAVFTSASCDTCAGVRAKAAVLESSEVAVVDVEYGQARALHDRYGIDAVPTLVIADHAGVVSRSFVGPMTATDLWAAVAEARRPGVAPEQGMGRAEDPGPQSSD